MKIVIKTVWVVILISIGSIVNAQVSNDTLQAYQYFLKGDSLLKQSAYKKSITSFKNAASIFKKHEAWRRYVNSLNKITENHYQLRELDVVSNISDQVLSICKEKLENQSLEEAKALIYKGKIGNLKNDGQNALKYYMQSLKIIKKRVGDNHIKTASLYNNIGMAYDENLGLVNKAQNYYSKSLKINQKLYDKGEDNDLNAVYLNLAILYSENGLYHKAQPMLKEVLDQDKKKYGKLHPYVAEDYYNLGVNYNFIEENHLSLQYYLKGLEILLQLFDEDDIALAASYNAIGNQYSTLEEYDLAHKNFEKALRIYLNTYGENNLATANTISNMASGVFLLQNEYDLATEYYNKSYEIREKLFGKNHRNTSVIYPKMADIHEAKQEYDLAQKYNYKYLDFTLQNFKNKNQKTAEAYISIGNIETKKKNILKAITAYHKAIISATYSFDRTSIFDTPPSDDYINLNTTLAAVGGKAKALLAYAQSNKNDQYLKYAYDSFIVCDELIDKTRNSYSTIEDKLFLEKVSSTIYEDAVTVSLTLFTTTKEKKYAEKAFFFSEKNRSRLLEEQIRKSKAKDFVKIPQEELQHIKDTNIELALYKSKQHNIDKNDSILANSYSSAIFSLTHKKDSLTTLLENNYPKYYRLKYDNHIISIADIQKQLDKQTVVLEYLVTDTHIYTFVISQNDFSVRDIKMFNLNKKVLQLREAILTKTIPDYVSIAFELYQKLIATCKLPEDKKRVVIIPDSSLWNLNFEMLLTQKTNSNNPKKLPYLLRKKIISYGNSANLLFNHTTVSTKGGMAQKCLAFSFSDSTSLTSQDQFSNEILRNTDDDLPGTRREIKEISEIIDGTFFYGKKSTEANFKKNAKEYGLLHLALHGEINHENPEDSKLYFTQVNDSIQDNYLYIHELYALDIPAELAVLSSCNTGSGKISEGEGIMSLGRAFQYAGTKSLILTNWEVSDETTPEVMKNFYVNLKNGVDKAKSLQQAKLTFLEQTDVFTTDPFYWGGFYLIGDTTRLDLKENHSYLYLIIPVLLLLGFLYMYNQKRRNKQG